MAYRDRTSTKIKGAILAQLVKLTYRLPKLMVFGFAYLVNLISRLTRSRSNRVIRQNLALCYPELSVPETEQLIKQIHFHNACLLSEFATAWLGRRDQILNQIGQIHHQSVIDDLLEQNKTVVVAVLHLGNWEYLWQWLQIHYPAFGMYQPSKFKQLDEIVLESRTKFGGKAHSTDPKGIMGLLKQLRQHGVMMILPDQAPREGAGIYTPFFGHPAYTMTLLHKLLIKSGATLVFGNSIRNTQQSCFDIHLEKASFDCHEPSVEVFNQQMNQQIEAIVRRWPAQYQWNYKRFKRQPEGKKIYD
ncbi:lysophospholipid acyltransferase family protein [Aliikangiella maris]|uniref:Lysophospholipid acyltransferase family protein n=2 Tax=Aliikangiella maris TaxID=3162458 RepID=A0ABV3MNT1_9GAMM